MPATDDLSLSYPAGINTYNQPLNSNTEDTSNLNYGVSEKTWQSQNGVFIPTAFEINDQFSNWTVDEALHATLFEPPLPFTDPATTTIPIPSAYNGQLQADRVKDTWFTQNADSPSSMVLENPSECTSGIASPLVTSSPEVNDYQRTRLQRRLQIRSFETPIPSTEFLNSCIRLYFSKGHTFFPVVHPATFRPSKANTPLTLAVCVMGTLFMSSQQALDVGVHLFERLNKATLLYWEKAKKGDPSELISIIQGAVLAQAFSLLSGIPSLLLTADAFHGPPIAWSRHQGLFRVRHSVNIRPNLPPEDLEQIWREWAKNEEYIRTTHALAIVDAELARLLHHEPVMRLRCKSLVPSASNQLFMARNANEWKYQYLSETQNWSIYGGHGLSQASIFSFDISKIPTTSTFTAYAVLQELGMRVIATKSEEHNAASTMQVLYSQLCAFFHQFLSNDISQVSELHGLQVLWHSVFISMFTDLDLLEKAVGREGSQIAAEERVHVTRWAESGDAKRAVSHALLVKRRVESMTVLDEPAIHIPLSLFNAGVVLFCYGKFGSRHEKEQILSPDRALPEFKLLGRSAASLLQGAWESSSCELMFQDSLYTIMQLLQRIGSWGLSRRFATILGTITAEDFSTN